MVSPPIEKCRPPKIGPRSCGCHFSQQPPIGMRQIPFSTFEYTQEGIQRSIRYEISVFSGVGLLRQFCRPPKTILEFLLSHFSRRPCEKFNRIHRNELIWLLKWIEHLLGDFQGFVIDVGLLTGCVGHTKSAVLHPSLLNPIARSQMIECSKHLLVTSKDEFETFSVFFLKILGAGLQVDKQGFIVVNCSWMGCLWRFYYKSGLVANRP